MDNKEIQSILQDALEEEIPSSQVNLWTSVEAELVAGKHQLLQQGEKMNTKKPQRRLRLAFAVLIILALLVVAFATPQGRSFAQSVLQLFVRAESTTIPLQPSQIVAGEPDQSAPTAVPPSPLISVEEAEEIAGFNVAVLPSVPDGYNYLGVRLYGETVSIEYAAQGNGSSLIIQQSPDGFYQSDWDKVPANAILTVNIGESDGEFVRGTFVVYTGETLATWNPDAPILRLRWMKDGIWFEMTKFGDLSVTDYLDQAGLVKLAESLIFEP